MRPCEASGPGVPPSLSGKAPHTNAGIAFRQGWWTKGIPPIAGCLHPFWQEGDLEWEGPTAKFMLVLIMQRVDVCDVNLAALANAKKCLSPLHRTHQSSQEHTSAVLRLVRHEN